MLTLEARKVEGGGMRQQVFKLLELVEKLSDRVEGKEWLSIRQVCELYEVSEPTVREWWDKGMIGRSQVGGVIRYSHADIKTMFAHCYKKKGIVTCTKE